MATSKLQLTFLLAAILVFSNAAELEIDECNNNCNGRGNCVDGICICELETEEYNPEIQDCVTICTGEQRRSSNGTCELVCNESEQKFVKLGNTERCGQCKEFESFDSTNYDPS
jgi:hypothetical protein